MSKKHTFFVFWESEILSSDMSKSSELATVKVHAHDRWCTSMQFSAVSSFLYRPGDGRTGEIVRIIGTVNICNIISIVCFDKEI